MMASIPRDQVPTPALTTAGLAEWREWPLVCAVLLVLIGFADSAASIARGWFASDTYLHGLIVVPVVIWLLWRGRAQATRMPGAVDWMGLAAFAALCGAWTAARLVHVQLIEQLAFVAMLPAVIWMLAGTVRLRAVAFPLAFLVLIVPMGEGLLRPLMTFTADCVVWGLRIAGVAVFRDGMLISTPAGDFEVAEACSGLRYLLASIAVGSIYGYLRFRTWRARLIVLASSVVIPIVVNGLRALTIVLVAQIWEMDAAMGLDHFVYGWIFFAFVVALIIWTGSLVHEPPLSTAVPAGVAQEQVRAGPTPGSWIVLLAAIFLVLSARVVVAYMERVADQQAAMPRAPALPAAQPGWTGPELLPGAWAPHFGNATLTLQGRYASTSGTVDLSITHYATQRQGSELVNSENELFDPVRWRNQSSREVAVPRRGWPTTTLQEVEILGAVERRLVWYWFDIGGRQTTSRTLAKLFELPARLVGRPDATLFAVSAAYAGKADIARDALAGFLAAHGSAIRSCAPAGSEAQCVQGGARDAGTAPEPAVP